MNLPQGNPTISFEPAGITRRGLIRGGAAVAAALGMELTHVREAQAARLQAGKETRPINVGFIGVGSQGYGVDFKRALSVPGVQMTGVCDIYEPNLNRALKDVPKARGHKDYRELLDRKDIEAVIIATPLYLHAPMTIAALQAGKHVFTEKMMAYSIEDAKKMARAAESAKKVLQIGHQRRADVMYNHAWEMINQKKACGRITYVRAQWNRNGPWRRPVPADTNDRHWNWRMYREYSQGLMAELGTHQIHAVNWFLGTRPKAVVGMGGIDYWRDGRSVFDNVCVIFEYPGGVKLNYTSITTNQYDGYYEQFMGKDGTLVISEEKATQTAFYREPSAEAEAWMTASQNGLKGRKNEVGLKLDPSATKKLNVSGVKVGERTLQADSAGKDSYQLEMEDFFNSIRTGAPITCDWKEALACTVAACRANEAIATQSRIEIPDTDYEV